MGDYGLSEDRDYEQWEQGYTEGDDGHLGENYFLDPDEEFDEESLLFAENAFSPHMMGNPVPRDGGQAPDVPEAELEDDGATTDPYEAIDQGKTYYPPEDPPTLPSERLRDVDIASGFSSSADEAPLQDSDMPERFDNSDWDISARVEEALRLHAYTSGMNIRVQVRDGIVTLRGVVDTLEDVSRVEDVASEVEGVEEVRERLLVSE